MYRDEPVSVTNPNYYRSHPSGVECIELIRHLPFSQGNAIKYLWRAGDKGGPEQLKDDLSKALWYIKDAVKTGAHVSIWDDKPWLTAGYEANYYGWVDAELPGQRKKAITYLFHENLYQAMLIVQAWLDSLE